MKHDPATGQVKGDVSDLPSLLDDADQLLREVQKGAAERASDESAMGDREGGAMGGAGAESIRTRHAAIEQTAQAAAAAVAVLRDLLLSPASSVGAALDAPYGHGAPLRQHPGAICAIVADRAEGLAGALEAAAIIKANATP